jgi:peptidyl-prolyl cis-trans isomerase SurA
MMLQLPARRQITAGNARLRNNKKYTFNLNIIILTVMKRLLFKSLVFVLLIPSNLFSQKSSDDPVILTIDKQNITKSEFLRIYKKNNSQANHDSKSLHEYMDMFVNYKLKVIEAEHLGYDTASSFLKEFNNYRYQLAQPYLYDSAAENEMLHDIYKRLQIDLKLRQIFVKVHQNASPEDTLVAYNKILEAREKLIKGEPWDSIVMKYSEDGYTRKRKGVMGYITALQILYPIENAAYKLRKDEISMPVRSRTGYHVIQLMETRPSRGELQSSSHYGNFP